MSWKEVFEIKEESALYNHLTWNSKLRTPYHLIHKGSGEIVAKYRDMVYAEKQAKRKYKRLSRKMEKLLLE